MPLSKQVCSFIGCDLPTIGNYSCKIHIKYWQIEVRTANGEILELLPAKKKPQNPQMVIYDGADHSIKFDKNGHAFILIYPKTTIHAKGME